MKSTTYSALVMMLFFRNLGKGQVESIKTLISLVDKVSLKLTGAESDLSYETKHRLIKELIKEGILESKRKFGTYSISISKESEKYITELITIMLE